jgi:hypothetical protein
VFTQFAAALNAMRDKRRKILEDPRDYLRKQMDIPDDLDDLPEEERDEYIEEIENAAISFDPTLLKEEILQIGRLIDQARALEYREIESKLVKLKKVLAEQEIFSNPNMKLLVFTEHKDTLDYLAGDGQDGRPLGKLREWGLKVTQIHGGMKIGDRDTPGTRICAEREFREEAQILVATEAAGEGINLQFCWLMINYDIPWNPVRLEQRMGSHPSLRTRTQLPHFQFRRSQHTGRSSAPETARTVGRDSKGARHRPCVRCGR